MYKCARSRRVAAGSVAAVLAVLAVAGCSSDDPGPVTTEVSVVTSARAAATGFAVTSRAFAENTEIPAEYSCDERNVPPPLQWRNVPSGTESLAVVVDDPDAPAGLYVHWVVTGIPVTTSEIVNGALPDAAVVSLNSEYKQEYLGPCAPAGTGIHHYRFQVYALRESLTLTPTMPAPEAAETIAERSVAVARTVGLFGR